MNHTYLDKQINLILESAPLKAAGTIGIGTGIVRAASDYVNDAGMTISPIEYGFGAFLVSLLGIEVYKQYIKKDRPARILFLKSKIKNEKDINNKRKLQQELNRLQNEED